MHTSNFTFSARIYFRHALMIPEKIQVQEAEFFTIRLNLTFYDRIYVVRLHGSLCCHGDLRLLASSD